MKKVVALSLFLFAMALVKTQACTRMVYLGKADLVITARSMDWKEEIGSNLWIFPRGIKHNGMVGSNSFEWVSKYGSVTTSAFDIATSDGMNEKGLVANLLWLGESQYPQWDQKHPGLSIGIWAQYVLDRYATVEEAVADLEKENFTIVTANIPGTEMLATVHLAISDKLGDSAIFEYVDGKLVIHHSKSYQVMTNSPVFDKQLALSEYWKEIGGTVMLPGTNRAADRFVRASFYINAIPKTDDWHIGVASVFSVIRNCSVPYGISTPDQPNISSTRWRSVSDHKNLVYYFESSLTPNTFWVDLKRVDFSEKGSVKKLTITGGEIYSGDTSSKFVVTKPFTFAGL